MSHLAIEPTAHETWIMAAWVGLVGVLAGALFAFAGQYALRHMERQDRYDALLLEQFTCIIGLSEDFRNRIWEERKQVASDVVSKWDLAAYRRAEALLRILSQQSVREALENLDEAGANLGDAWRTKSGDNAAIDSLLADHRKAIEQLVDVSSDIMQHRAAAELLRQRRRAR